MLKFPAGSPRKSHRRHAEPPAYMKLVEVPQIMAIFNELYGDKVVAAVTKAPKSFPLPQKILVCTLLLMLKHGKSGYYILKGKYHLVIIPK